MARLALALMVIVPLLTTTIALAQDSLSIRHLDEMANLSENPRIQIYGSLMVVSAKSGLIVTDISDPEHPVSRNILTNLEPRGWDFSPPFALYGDLLAVAYHETVSLYRIHSIENVQLLDQLSFEDHWCSALAINHVRIVAYISTLGLVTINSQDPADLSHYGTFALENIPRYFLVKRFQAFSWGYDSTEIITFIDPQEPRILSTFRRANDIAVDNDRLFLLTRDSLFVHDIEDPENPNLIASLTTNGAEYRFNQAISVEGNRVAIAFDGGMVKLYELDEEFNLNELGAIRTPTRWPRDCQIRGDNIFSAGGVWGGVVTVIDASEPANLREVAEIGLVEDNYPICVNDYLIFPSDTSIITKYRLVDGEFQLVYRGFQDWDEQGGYFGGGTVVGDVVYDAFYGIRIWDCSDPLDIRFGTTANWPANEEINRFAANESFAGVVWRDSLLEIFSTENLFDPSQIGHLEFSRYIAGIGLGDSLLFAAERTDSLRMMVIDLHDPQNITVTDSVTIGDRRAHVWGIVTGGDIAYAVPDFQCRLFDVSDPRNVFLASTIDSVYSILTVDHWMIYSHWVGGLRVVDVSDPTQPREVARYDDEKKLSLRQIDNGRVVASYHGGVVAFQIDGLELGVPAEPEIVPEEMSITAYPNPFNSTTRISFTVGQVSKPVTLAIYDLSGREVADLSTVSPSRLTASNETVGYGDPTVERQVTWDAFASPAGLYFVRLKAGNVSATQKLMLVK